MIPRGRGLLSMASAFEARSGIRIAELLCYDQKLMAKKHSKGPRSPRDAGFISESDVALVKEKAVLRAAEAAGLETGLMARSEIVGSLRVRNPELSQALQGFVQALDAWFNFHLRVSNRSGGLTERENEQLIDFIQRKEGSRERLVALTVIPGREMARVWINDSLNPILERLLAEIPRLEQRAWTWRFHTRECDVIFALAPFAQLILRTQTVIAASLRELLQEHDGRLLELLAKLQEAQQALEQDGVFTTKVTEKLIAHRARYPTDRPWGAFAEDRIIPLCAQYILNGTEDVPLGTTTMDKFWNENRGEIASVVDVRRLEPPRPVGDQLLSVCRRLQTEVERLRDRLVRLHDIASSSAAPLSVPERF